MNLGKHLNAVLYAILCLGFSGVLQAQVRITTYHNDTSRTGAYTQETILTPANVNTTQFGKLFSVIVDGVRLRTAPVSPGDEHCRRHAQRSLCRDRTR